MYFCCGKKVNFRCCKRAWRNFLSTKPSVRLILINFAITKIELQLPKHTFNLNADKKQLDMEKRNKIIYWITTALMSFGMLGSGIAQISHAEEMNAILTHLGYPLYFMSIIGVWKVLGVVAILVPGFKLVKEWAYAGFFILMTGAFLSHLFVGDPFTDFLGPVFQTIFIVCSWYFRPENRKLIV